MAAGALPSMLALKGDSWTGRIQQQELRGVRSLTTAGTTPRMIRMIRCTKAADEDAVVKAREGPKHDDTLAQRGRHAGTAAAMATAMMDAFQDMSAKLQEHAICCAAMHCVYCDVLPKSRNCRLSSPSPSWRPALEGASSSLESKKPLRLSSTSWDLLD